MNETVQRCPVCDEETPRTSDYCIACGAHLVHTKTTRRLGGQRDDQQPTPDFTLGMAVQFLVLLLLLPAFWGTLASMQFGLFSLVVVSLPFLLWHTYHHIHRVMGWPKSVLLSWFTVGQLGLVGGVLIYQLWCFDTGQQLCVINDVQYFFSFPITDLRLAQLGFLVYGLLLLSVLTDVLIIRRG